MSEFVEAVRNYPLMQHAVLAALLASVAGGVVGTYVVVRRITYLAGGIAHCVLGGMGAAVWLRHRHGLDFIEPMHGAIVAGILAALVIGLISLRARQREDTVIGALWAVGMAAGLLFLWATPGYGVNLMSYLFGNILMVRAGDLVFIAVLDAVVAAVAVLFYHELMAVCFDEEFARLRGVNVELFYLLLLCLTALTVVLLVTVVGIVMTIALLTLPAAIAGQFARTLWQNMLLAILIGAVGCIGGLALSYGPDLPAGATIIALIGAVYLFVVVGRTILRRLRR
ncbi:MAG TPA: metal ABC transporter permease [Phycisphaerae bacterium]|nr:metal ABC transporter permease [Phycisphaerae bacterium]HOI56878.1 metal ABC transporter permease [Phycisphaerae bacterium]